MKKHVKFLALVMAVLLLAGSLAGCKAGTQTAAPTAEPSKTEGKTEATAAPKTEPQTESKTDYMDKVVTVGIISTWGLLCPNASTDSYSRFTYDVLYEKLVFVNGDYTISPRAADSWEPNADFTAYTFHLNKDVKWHDGTPVTAKDWVFAAQTMTDPAFVSGAKSIYNTIAGTDKDGNETAENSVAFEAVDDYTLKITFKAVTDITAFFVSNNNGIYPMPSHLLKDIPTAKLLEDAFWQKPVGCGVGIYNSQMEGSTITFDTNQSYYRGAPKFGQLVFRVVGQDSLAAGFLAGELDLTYSSAPLADALAAAQDAKVEPATTSVAVALCWMNMNLDKLNDVRLRQAVRYCVNQEAISAILYEGTGVISASPTVQVGDYYTDTIEYAAEYSAEKAAALFKEAGWNFNDTFLLGTPSGAREKAAAVIAQGLQAAGIKVEVQVGDATTVFANAKTGKYHASLQSTSAWTNDPLTTRNTMNTYIYTFKDGPLGTELNGILDEMAAELDGAKRVELARKWLERVTELAVFSCVYRAPQYMLHSARVQGWNPDNQAVGFNNNYHDLIVD